MNDTQLMEYTLACSINDDLWAELREADGDMFDNIYARISYVHSWLERIEDTALFTAIAAEREAAE